MTTLDGRTAIVTGAASGIGRVSALALARAGASVVVVDRDADGGHETASLIAAAGGASSFFRADVTDTAEVAAMVDHALATFGRFDCAHNNAGVLGAGGVLADYDDDDWDRVLAVNLTAIYLCLKHEIKALLAAGTPGSIVNTASFSGLGGRALRVRIRRLEARCRGPDPGGRRRVRPEGHPGQRRLSRKRAYPDDGRSHRRQSQDGAGALRRVADASARRGFGDRRRGRVAVLGCRLVRQRSRPPRRRRGCRAVTVPEGSPREPIAQARFQLRPAPP